MSLLLTLAKARVLTFPEFPSIIDQPVELRIIPS